MKLAGAVIGAMLGSFAGGPIGAAAGVVLGTAAEEYISKNGIPLRRGSGARTATVRMPSAPRPTSSDAAGPRPGPDPTKTNICPQCKTPNLKTSLLCEYCGERLPVKQD